MRKPGTKRRSDFEVTAREWSKLVEAQRKENRRQAEFIERLMFVAERLGRVNQELLLYIDPERRPMVQAEAQLRADGKIVTIATHVC